MCISFLFVTHPLLTIAEQLYQALPVLPFRCLRMHIQAYF